MKEPMILPTGWMWIKLGEIITFEYGRGLRDDKRDQNGNVPVYGSNGIVGYHSVPLIENPCLIIGRKGAAGYVHISKVPCWPIDTTYYIIPPDELNLVCFYHLLSTLNLNSLDKSTAIPGLNRNDAYALEIPLPPLPEQRAIASKIEQLFSDLDSGISNFKKAQAQLKRYRQSVLKAACEGKLVPTEAELAHAEEREYEAADVLLARIKEEYEKSGRKRYKEIPFLEAPYSYFLPEGWTITNFSMLINKIKRGPSMKCNQEGKGIRYITSGNLQDGKVMLDMDYKFLEGFNNIDSCRLLPEDLIFNCVNSLEQIGKSAVFESRYGEAIVGFNNYALELRTNFITPQYANIFCQSKIAKKQIYFLIKRAVNQVSFATRELDFIAIPTPPLAEQRRIVAEVERRLSLSDKMEATIAESLQKAESLRQSILKKAFEGKLLNEKELEKARNAPDWEPAEKLLERIKTEKKNIKTRNKAK